MVKRGRSSIITFQPKNSTVLARIASQLSQFFGFPVMALDGALEKHVATLHLSFDRSSCLQFTFLRLQRMVEIGPRVTLSKLIWEVSP